MGHCAWVHHRAGLSTSTPGGKLEGEYDDVVIGGGIMGSSTAYEVSTLASGLAAIFTRHRLRAPHWSRACL